MALVEEEPTTPWHLRDNRAPVAEEITVSDLEITGQIPAALNGRYFRNGANPRTGTSPHWFLGNGMVHGLELSEGRVQWYRNRYMRTPFWDNPDAERIDMSTGNIDRKMSAANTHIVRHAGRIMALEEGSFPFEVDECLETVGFHDFDGKLTTAMTAHPKICAETGDLVFFGYDLMPPYFTYHVADAAGNLVHTQEIEVAGATMHHDFAASRNHSIVMDLPIVFDLELAMAGSMPMKWSDDYQARMGVLPRMGGDVTWFDIDPCYVFHTANAWDDGDKVVVVGCRYEEMWRNDSQIGDSDGAAADDPAGLHKWTLDLSDGSVTEEALDDEGVEFPRVADEVSCTPSRYAYTLAGLAGTSRILKYDLENGAAKTAHQCPTGTEAGEAVFVADPDGSAEDDGWLLTFMHDTATDQSRLSILDARDVEAAPIAEVQLPQRVPTGFHGSWIAD